MKNVIQTDSLEIFKNNIYLPDELGMVSNNAYLSIVTTNKCQCSCPYCINSLTDRFTDLPIDKAVNNIKRLVKKYKIKEAILLGGEPLMHPNLLELVSRLRKESGLEMLRMTTNGLGLLSMSEERIKKLVDKETGIQGINISHHNEKNFMSYDKLREICTKIKEANPEIKIRINSNVWKGNLDDLVKITWHISKISNFADEMRLSNIIRKDSFSVNPNNKDEGLEMILSDEEYEKLFTNLINFYSSKDLTIIENKLTLGFVRYFLIPTKMPIIVNWNIDSKVSEQICENDIKNRKINTFKCLVNGEISLSWNTDNIIKL